MAKILTSTSNRREYMMNIISKILKYLKKNKTTIKRMLVLIVAGVFVATVALMLHYRALYNEQTSISGELTSNVEQTTDINTELNAKVQEQEQQLNAYKTEVDELKAEIEALKKENQELSKELANRTTYPDKEYRQSTYVWNHLKSLGLNDYVCAGILGNIMAEVGGQTLDISKYSAVEVDGDSRSYFGNCQWAGGRKDRLLKDFGNTLDAQCRFLGVELFEVIPKDNSFYSMQDEKEAALYFAKHYERCGSGSYNVRQKNATKALQYFTGDTE